MVYVYMIMAYIPLPSLDADLRLEGSGITKQLFSVVGREENVFKNTLEIFLLHYTMSKLYSYQKGSYQNIVPRNM